MGSGEASYEEEVLAMLNGGVLVIGHGGLDVYRAEAAVMCSGGGILQDIWSSCRVESLSRVEDWM